MPQDLSSALGESAVLALKLGLALGGVVLLAWSAWLERTGRAQRHKRARDVALAVLGALSFAAWWNFGRLHFVDGAYVHAWEHFHYYLGSKYAPELGYTRLYDCATAADLADGLRAQVEARRIRDLSGTRGIVSTARVVADPGSCTSHFSPERWQEFRRDIRFFRDVAFTEVGWAAVQRDHGYNATPVWSASGRLLAEAVPLSERGLFALALVDPVLLAAMWALTWWAFGWRVACVAVIWWGTNYPARFYWNGGGLLRFDWLAALVAGIGFLRRDKPFAAGAALTCSALLRVFPVFVIAALALHALFALARARSLELTRVQRSFVLGSAAALGVLLLAATWATGSFLPAWAEFARNSARHLATPTSNAVGLETALDWSGEVTKARLRTHDPEAPFEAWVAAKRELRDERRPLALALAGAFLILHAFALRHGPEWAAASLGCGLVFSFADVSCYYYGFMLCYGFLCERDALAGILLSALAAASVLLAFVVSGDDAQYAATSALIALYVACIAARAVRRTGNDSGGHRTRSLRPSRS